MSLGKNTESTTQKPGDWTNYGTVSPIAEDIHQAIDPLVGNQEEKGSNWTAFVHIVCVIAGSGTLGIAYAIQQGGWLSLLFLILVALGCVYSNNKLIEALYYDGTTRKHTISQIAYDAFGTFGLVAVSFFYYSAIFGSPVLYLVLSGDNLQVLFGNLGLNLGMKNWVYICAGVMTIPFVLLKTMKEAAWLSLFGVLTTFIVVVVVSYMSIADYSNHSNSGHDIINIQNIPLTMGTFSYSYSGNVIFPNVEAGMRTPSSWPLVNYLAILFITFMYFLIGIPAYLTYGYSTTSPTYLNLPPGLAVDISIFLITIHVLLTIPILLTSLSLDIEEYTGINALKLGENREFIARTILRTSLMMAAVCIAITAPYFSDVMTLLGAICTGLLFVLESIEWTLGEGLGGFYCYLFDYWICYWYLECFDCFMAKNYQRLKISKYYAIIGLSIAVLNKFIIESSSNINVKSAEFRKKKRSGVLENNIGNKKFTAAKVSNGYSWGSKTGNTIKFNSVDIEEKCLIEETSFDYGNSRAFAKEDLEQMSKSSKILTKRMLKKLLRKINFLGNNIDNILSDKSVVLLSLLKNLVNVSVKKSFALDISLDNVVGKSAQKKLVIVRKLFSKINDFEEASTSSKFAGIIRATFTSELSLVQASKKAEEAKILTMHTALSEFDTVVLIKMQLVGLWQKAVVKFGKIEQADLVATCWSILIGKDAVHIARAD
ncbi:hypothetical protein G9A89_001495 [Geosiphon pyriformis]|nr:hypothetical protein G9A89_001495 [Geosiphon pyriformis]